MVLENLCLHLVLKDIFKGFITLFFELHIYNLLEILHQTKKRYEISIKQMIWVLKIFFFVNAVVVSQFFNFRQYANIVLLMGNVMIRHIMCKFFRRTNRLHYVNLFFFSLSFQTGRQIRKIHNTLLNVAWQLQLLYQAFAERI